MALRIRKGEDDGNSGRGGLVADRRLYRRADGTPCERGDPRAAFLLAGRGKKVPPEYVERYDMRSEGGRVVWGKRKAKPPPPKPAPEPETPVETPEPVEDGSEEDEGAPEWHLATPPDDYLEKWPEGPNADLARRVLARDGG